MPEPTPSAPPAPAPDSPTLPSLPSPTVPGAPAPAEPRHASPLARLWAEIREMFRGVDAQAATSTVVAMAALTVAHAQGSTWFYRVHFAPKGAQGPLHDYFPTLYWHLAAVALYLVFPLLAAALTPGTRVKGLGLGLGDWRLGWKATVVVIASFLPVVFAASRFDAFANHYPLCKAAKTSLGLFLAYELSFAAYFVAWEFLFRGYLLFTLERSMGKMAVFAQMMPFVIIHFGKPQAEVFGSIVAGVALGMLALRTRSVWYGALIHIAAAASMDVFASWKDLFP